MLKGLITWFLNNYLGKYLQDLNTHQLSVALLQGEVELENVPLRKDALRFLDSSLCVRQGTVGHIKLKVPISQLRSEPWSIEIDQVYVVIAPQCHEDYDEIQDNAVQQEIKLSALDGIESEWRAQYDSESPATTSYYPSYSAWMSFGTSFIGTIIENLQVKISNVHIRYEDDVSIPSKPIVCGFSLDCLSAQSCDENWIPKFVCREKGQKMAFKLVELENMAVYVNNDDELLGSLDNNEFLAEKMSVRNRGNIEKFHHILDPISASATIRRNCTEKPLNTRKTPRITCSLETGEVHLNLTDDQFKSAVTSARTLHQLHKNKNYWKWRPRETVSENPGAWWQYVITCEMERIHERNNVTSWESVLQKARDNVKYVQAFKSYLENPVVFDEELKEHKDSMDLLRSYDELKVLREQAVLLLERELQKNNENENIVGSSTPQDQDVSETATQSTLQRWFPLWGGWYGSTTDEVSEEHQHQEYEAAELDVDSRTRFDESKLEEEIIEAISDADLIGGGTVPYKDVVFLLCSFSMTKATTKLSSMSNADGAIDKKTLFEFEFTDAKVEIENRPRIHSNRLELSLGAMCVRDFVTQDTMFPVLISPLMVKEAPLFPKKSGATSSAGAASGLTGLSGLAKTFQSYLYAPTHSTAQGPLFYLLYEKKPFGSSKVDIRLHVKSQPLNIVYNPTVVHCIGNFFKIPEDLNDKNARLSEKIRQVAFTKIDEVKELTKAELKRNIDFLLEDTNSSRKNWDIDFDLCAPQIIIPENFFDKEATIMVVDLGKFHLESETCTSIRKELEELQKQRQQAAASSTSSYYGYLPNFAKAKSTTTKETSVACDDSDDEDDEEEFITPASSPMAGGTPPITSPAAPSATATKSPETSHDQSGPANKSDLEIALSRKLYERFTISLSDMQVILGRVKDNWRHAHVKGNSSLHLLDKFSIALHCERRVMATKDLNMPNVAISGTLPKLSVHINEDKIFLLDRIHRLLSQSSNGDEENEVIRGKSVVSQTLDIMDENAELVDSSMSKITDSVVNPPHATCDNEETPTKLFLIYFCIADMSVELQSLGKSIVELQVTGVKASLTKRSQETNIGLSVHSLLLVDALQTFGPNYELLVASHRNVMVDSMSGSLKGSDPVSPCSPSSPNPAATSESSITSPIDLAKALANLQSTSPRLFDKHRPNLSGSSNLQVDIVDPDALISVEILVVEPSAAGTTSTNNLEPLERIQVLSIQFNSLDVIANQETIIELLSFGQRVIPQSFKNIEPVGRKRRKATKDQSCQTDELCETPLNTSLLNLSLMTPYASMGTKKDFDQKIDTRTEITADFQRLNVLLLRAGTGRMIGTALLTEARVHSTFGQTVNVSGSLGGLQINTLLPGTQLHQRIISVGKDPSCYEHGNKNKSNNSNIHTDLYGKDHLSSMDGGNGSNAEEKQALTFSMTQQYSNDPNNVGSGEFQFDTITPMQEYSHESDFRVYQKKRTQKIDIKLRMASVSYLHSPPFLKELNSCATDFIHFLSKLASSIKVAATDLALGIVQRRTESIGHQASMEEMYWTPLKQGRSKANKVYDPYGSLERGVKLVPPATTPAASMPKMSSPLDNLEISVDAILETPILVLPRCEHSSEVLVAHLGMITIQNESIEANLDRILFTISKMNVCTLDLLDQIRKNYSNNSSNYFSKSTTTSASSSREKVDMLEIVAMAKTLPTELLYSSSSDVAFPFLHDTEISLNIDRKSMNFFPSSTMTRSDSNISDTAARNVTTNYQIRGQVKNSLKLSLFRSQYEQILDSMSNLTTNSSSESYGQNISAKVQEDVSSSHDETSKNPLSSNVIDGSFGVSELVFELVGEALGSGKGQPLVNVQLEQFFVKYREDSKSLEKCTEITLGSIIIEDLSLSKDSPHRTLATSISSAKDEGPKVNLTGRTMSSSCPDLTLPAQSSNSSMSSVSSSLPDQLDTKCVFDNFSATATTSATKNFLAPPIPATPPPSEADDLDCSTPVFDTSSTWQNRSREDNLVHVKIENLNPQCSRWDGTHRIIDIDLNTLDVIFNLKSWVMIFDFFGIGSPKVEKVKKGHNAEDFSRFMIHDPGLEMGQRRSEEIMPKEHVNSEIDIKVKALSVILNHSNYEVAHAMVKKFTSRMSLRNGNFAINGTLGKFLVLDLTSQGSLYRDRFLSTHGHDTMLYFDFFKYGDAVEASKEPHDARLKIRMASVIYVHTQRFYSELLAFFNHFHQHQNVMNRIREAAMGSDVSEVASRGTRIHLDIEAGSPLLLLPVSSTSNRLIVVHLGLVEASNTFKYSGDDGTISSQTLRSALASQLVSKRRRRSGSRSTRTSRRSSRSRTGFKSPTSNRSSTHHSRSRMARISTTCSEDDEKDDVLKELQSNSQKCLLDVLKIRLSSMDLRTADRLSAFSENITSEDILVGGFIVRQHKEQLLREKCEFQLQIERNLDSALSHNVPDISLNGALSCVHATLDDFQYRIVRGLLSHNLGENLDDLLQFRVAVPTNEYQEPSMQTILSGITWSCMYINLQLQDVTLDLKQSHCKQKIFARVNFVKSLLTYESFSDSSRDIDLVSQEILLDDLRYQDLPMNNRPSVYPHILQPMVLKGERNSLLQAEVHFRLTPDTNRITILVNNMRLMGIFDWWLLVLDFISLSPEGAPPQNDSSESAEEAQHQNLSNDFEEKDTNTKSKFYSNEEPLYPSAGIVSRRAPVVESKGPVFELKLNITDSDFIVVVEPSLLDSSAVILRSTTVIAYRPDMVERPFSCNLNNAEVFSCFLGNEDGTALSIIDPVTINFEIAGRSVPGMPSKGLTDLLVDQKDTYNLLGTYERTAEIQLQQLNVRFSYHDWQMFQRVLDSFPRQAREAFQSRWGTDEMTTKNDDQKDRPHNPATNIDMQIKQLMDLGFSKEDCQKSLELCNGQLDEAALWLTQNVDPVVASSTQKITNSDDEDQKYYLQGTNVSFTNFECKISAVNICIIDDCRDADVPLVELTVQRLHFHHDFEGIGEASSTWSSMYYNRALSTWEPLMEPWVCSVGWKINQSSLSKRLTVHLEAEEVVNLNITSTLIELYSKVKADWTVGSGPLDNRVSGGRIPFVPFVLRNETGVDLWFCTHTKSSVGMNFIPNASSSSLTGAQHDPKWVRVKDREEANFSFEEIRSKTRQLNIGEIKSHQIIVRVSGWSEVTPVSVDRVGIFFRRAMTATSATDTSFKHPPIRVVFEVSIRGSAMKLVTIRSSLLVENKLTYPMELMLDNAIMKVGDKCQLVLNPSERKALPLKYVWAKLSARPYYAGGIGQWKFSEKFIEWYHIMSSQDDTLSAHSTVHLWRNEVGPQRFCVAVRRKNYPSETESLMVSTPKDMSRWIQPAHTISFVPPVTIVNLLPCHLSFRIVYFSNSTEKITSKSNTDISPGKKSFISVDIEQNVRIELLLDLYPKGAELNLQPGRYNYDSKLIFEDCHDRRLQLTARVEAIYGGAIRVSIMAQHWLVNKTGLPLIFRQEGSSIDVPGQEEENEMARLAAPLMFCFQEELSETSNTQLTMRIGNGLHLDGNPQWCRSFPLQPGSRVRKLTLIPKDSRRVGRIYIIGIDVRVGKGRYRDTLIVTFSPRFQLHNLSQYRVQLSQRCFATTFHDLEAEATHLQAYPQSCLAFHWPRLDRDQLLCLRLIDAEGVTTMWSGGFTIDRVESFHINLRDKSGRSIFIRVEVSLFAATFCSVLSDATNFPPPFRLDNFSEVHVTCHQSGVTDENFKTVVKAHQSVPYAWDEPSLPPHLTCCAPGGSSATYNMNVVGEGSQLTYENFIYIAITETFGGCGTSTNDLEITGGAGPGMVQGVHALNLVFDVEGTRVFLAPKEAGKRSQLWRMTSAGLLVHEGSSPPQMPRGRGDAHQDLMANNLVLDIAGPAVQPNTYVPLMLRKPDERRQLTQRWRFTEDGKLMCTHRGLYVQAKDGFSGLQLGSDVVLGPPHPISMERTDLGVPIEQAISRQRLRPGSGTLCVRVTTDGPTRVLQVMDINKSNRPYAKLEDSDWTRINESRRPQVVVAVSGEDRNRKKLPNQELQVTLMAKSGIGISLVNRDPPEELLYAYMSNVVIDYQQTTEQTNLDGSIQNIQIDNQLYEAQFPVILCLTPATRSDEYRHMPALSFTLNKVNVAHDNAEIYKHLMVQIKNMTLNLEEDLLCKVLRFAGIMKSDEEMERIDETAHDPQHALIAATRTAKRFYFGTLKLALNQVKLSVTRSHKLSQDLVAVKRKLGLSLIAFEDALIDLDPFIRVHPFETINFLTNSVVKHYTDELLSQAVLILGATDFLGNPIGFLNDIHEGVSSLLSDGDVGGLLKSVTHGAANSAAKVSGSLSYGISKATVYDKYNEKRLMLRRQRGDTSKEYLVDGLKGLGFGVVQGLTSIVTETYEGVANDGLSGFFSGLTWGLIGTVSKPALGVLDLATGAATAVKESSRSKYRVLPPKLRPPRLVLGSGGNLPIYTTSDALGQALLYRLNGRDITEIYVAHEQLRTGPEENLQLLLSCDRVLIFTTHTHQQLAIAASTSTSAASTKTPTSPIESPTANSSATDLKELRIMINISHVDLVCARTVSSPGDSGGGPADEEAAHRYYIELVGQFDDNETRKRPQVRCDNERIARRVTQKINYARNMFDEMTQAVIEGNDTHENEL